MSSDVLVVGGGVSGLIYARERALVGDSVTVLEADDHVGGAVWSHTLGGVESHTGAEAFAIGGGRIAQLVDELGLGDRVASPATGSSFIVTDSGAYPSPKNAIMGLPSKPFAPDVRAALGLAGAVRAWLERFLPTRIGLTEGVSIGEFTRKRYGRRVLNRLVGPIIQGIHSADPDKFELKAVMPSLPAAVVKQGSAQQAIEQMLVERGQRAGSGAAVRSLNPSMAELPKALARDIERAGGRVVTGATVVGLTTSGDRWEATASPQGEDERFSASSLVIATGPEVARSLLREASPAVADAIPAAPATPVRLVTLVLDNPELDAKPRGNGVLVAPGSVSIRAKAMTHASAKWEHVGAAARAVKPGRHVVRLSYGRGDSEALPDSGRFPDLAVRDAARILGLAESHLNLAEWAITDWSGTMRQSGSGHTAALERLTRTLAESHQGDPAPLPHLELVGAWRAGNGLEAITRFTRNVAKKGHTS